MNGEQDVFEAFERYQKPSVECGSEDLVDLGRIYEIGAVLKEGTKAAFECYKHAAESEDPEAMLELGLCYYQGIGTDKDLSKGYALILRASEMGNIEATASLGSIYIRGNGVRKNVERGLELLTRASEMGSVYAKEELANIYYFGEGVEADHDLAISLLRSASENGGVMSTFLINSLYAPMTDDSEEIGRRLEKIRECSDQGLILATMSLLNSAIQLQDPEEVEKRLNMVLEQTDEAGYLFDAALMYINYHGREGDTSVAIELLEKAAEQGKTEAYVHLGFLYDTPENTAHDTTKAFQCYSMAADRGDVSAIGLMGRAYEYGFGVPRDLYLAESWYSRGANENHPVCQFKLGILAEKGVSEPPNVNKGLHLLKKAFSNGYWESAYVLGKWYGRIETIKSMTDSVYWHMQGCEHDEPKCLIEMAKHYESGTFVKEDPAKALDLYRRLSECGENKDVGFANIGRFYEEGIVVKKDIRTARRYYREAAKDRNSFAMYRLYQLDKKAGHTDEAMFWLISSAERGSVSAMVELAARYENGEGVPRSRLQAIEWYHRASDKGHRDSKDNVASLLMMDDFEDEPTVYQNALRTAATKDRKALIQLGNLRVSGNGVRKSMNMAKRWFELASLYGISVGDADPDFFSGYGQLEVME